jgi:ADP-ribose pyrophosphatase YjhB (NUDIX family)
VRRNRHGEEWSLPKGKRQAGEEWTATALREVKEETGCEVRLGTFAGCLAYDAGGRAKVILFWNMEWVSGGPGEESDSETKPDTEAVPEVSEVRWCSVKEALESLTHEEQRELLKQAADGGVFCGCLSVGGGGAPPAAACLQFPVGAGFPCCCQVSRWRRFRIGPSGRRLLDEWPSRVAAMQSVLNHPALPPTAVTDCRAALALLLKACCALRKNHAERAWVLAHAAERLGTRALAFHNTTAHRDRAHSVQQEGNGKLKEWRLKAFRRHMGKYQAAAGRTAPAALAQELADLLEEAQRVLHGHFDNEGFKRSVQQGHFTAIVWSAVVLTAVGIVILIALPLAQDLAPRFLDLAWFLAAAGVVFGSLGACFSMLIAAFKDRPALRIPDVLYSSSVTSLRIATGAVAGLAILFLPDLAGIELTGQANRIEMSPLLAFVAGFSERLVVNSLSRFT